MNRLPVVETKFFRFWGMQSARFLISGSTFLPMTMTSRMWPRKPLRALLSPTYRYRFISQQPAARLRPTAEAPNFLYFDELHHIFRGTLMEQITSFSRLFLLGKAQFHSLFCGVSRGSAMELSASCTGRIVHT